MAAERKITKMCIIREVKRIYAWLDKQINGNPAAGVCGVCGRCCDFESYGHKLFVTTPEMLFFTDKLGSQNIRQMSGSRCPYLTDGPSTSLGMVSGSTVLSGSPSKGLSNHKCGVYKYRFAGCRIFCCKGDADFQSELTEAVLKKLKHLCEEFKIPYQYVDLPTALKQYPIGEKLSKMRF